MRFIISAGGTGGHIVPAINVATELKEQGHEVLYLGNKDSMEQAIAEKKGFDFFPINVQKLYRRITIKHLLFPIKLFNSVLKVRRLFNSFKPDAYIGTGGFVSGPGGYVAFRKGVPIFLQEQNSYPGLTTRLLARKSKFIFIGQQNAKKYLHSDNLVYSGNPINKNIVSSERKFDLTEIGLSSNKKTIFIIGGSQGSLFLNNLIDRKLDYLTKHYNVIWQLGKNTFHRFNDKNTNYANLLMFDFSYEIDKYYNLADIAICRSGALTIAELEAKKIPAIFIPLPTSAEDHQSKNAIEQEDKGLAKTLNQNNLDDNSFINEIDSMINNINSYRNNFSKCIHLTAVKVIVNKILENI